ncbi:MAG: Na+/H+ antiporter subunit E [Clostridiaceae bacterium]|nr:Na+/H+ antiporter subunit E [Clostridiaceae bacterium]
MRGRRLVLFILLLIFWFVISQEADLQHILAGVLVAFITVWFWQDLDTRQPGILSFRALLKLCRCLVLIVWYIIQSNIAVIKTLLFSNPPVNPVFVEFEPGIKSKWGRILFATCITITPGSVTVDIDPETGRFLVHALTEETADGIVNWRMIDEIKSLETQMQRGAEHVVDNGRLYGFDTGNTRSGNYRSNGD